jgi:hypothetical protein
MEFKEVERVWPLLQESKESIAHFSCMERRSSKCKHEEEHSQREDVSRLWSARQGLSIVNLWGHVDLGSHLFVDHRLFWHTKAKVTVLEEALLANENIL